MLFPTCLNFSVSLLLFSFYSFYYVRYSTWAHNSHALESKMSSDELAKHFDESWLKSLEWGYQSTSAKLVKVCAADSISLAPYHYKTEKDLDFYLKFPTAMNMSSRFTFLIQSGLIINGLLTLFHLRYSFQSSKQRLKSMGANVRCWSFLSLLWFLHLYLLVYWRLWLKQGHVCAGDFDGMKAINAFNVGDGLSTASAIHRMPVSLLDAQLGTRSPGERDDLVRMYVQLMAAQEEESVEFNVNTWKQMEGLHDGTLANTEATQLGDEGKKKEEAKKDKGPAKKGADTKGKDKKKKGPPPPPPAPPKPKINYLYFRKKEGDFLWNVAIAQLAGCGSIVFAIVLVFYLRFTGQMTPTLNRIEKIMIEQDLKEVLEQIKEGKKRRQQQQKRDDSWEDKYDEDGYIKQAPGYQGGEAGVRAEFYDSFEGGGKDNYRRA